MFSPVHEDCAVIFAGSSLLQLLVFALDSMAMAPPFLLRVPPLPVINKFINNYYK